MNAVVLRRQHEAGLGALVAVYKLGKGSACARIVRNNRMRVEDLRPKSWTPTPTTTDPPDVCRVQRDLE